MKLKSLKRRFGIQAPRVAVRPHVPWYLRWLVLTLGGVALGGLVFAAYHYGEEFAGFNRYEVQDKLKTLSAENTLLAKENAALKSELAVAERQLHIERATYGDLAKQVKTLSLENAQLREDVALVRTISSPQAKVDGVSVSSVRVEPQTAEGEYSYRIVLLQTGSRQKPFRGWYQLVVNMTQDGHRAGITLPANGEQAAGPYQLDFRVHQRIDGTFKVTPGAVVRSVQVRVFEGAQSQPKVMQTINVS